jgi:hypothetical protein
MGINILHSANLLILLGVVSRLPVPALERDAGVRFPRRGPLAPLILVEIRMVLMIGGAYDGASPKFSSRVENYEVRQH